MITSAKGLKFLENEEGCVLKPYLDIVKKPTIGYGSTFWENGTPVKMTDKPITKERAIQLFKFTLKRYEIAVSNSITIKLNQNQFDALVSLCYNIGTTGFSKSTLVKKINTKAPLAEIEKWLKVWKNGGGRELPVLVGRRKREFLLYTSKYEIS